MQVCPNSGAFIARKSVEYRKSIFIYCSDILCRILSYNNFSDDNRKENKPMYWMPCPSVKGAISSPTITIFLKLSLDIISHNTAYSKFGAKLHFFLNTAKGFHKIMEFRYPIPTFKHSRIILFLVFQAIQLLHVLLAIY